MEKMNIKMKRTERGSPDGISVETYLGGKTYEGVPRRMGEQLVLMGAAEEVSTPKKGPAKKTKDAGAAPENK